MLSSQRVHLWMSKRLRLSKVAVASLTPGHMSKCHLRPPRATACLLRKAHLVMRQLKIEAYNGVVPISREVALMSSSLFTLPCGPIHCRGRGAGQGTLI